MLLMTLVYLIFMNLLSGTKLGYHAYTFGLFLDKLLQKTNPKGRDTASIFKEYIADPFSEYTITTS